MRYTLYLCSDSVDELDTCLKDEKLASEDEYESFKEYNGDLYFSLDLEGDLSFEAKAFVQKNKNTMPDWLVVLSDYLDVEKDDFTNQYNSALISIKVNARIFVLSFGYGYHALDQTKLVSDFGLKTCLNALNDEEIKSIDTRTIDLLARQERIRLASSSELEDFGIDVNQDWLRGIEGRPGDIEGEPIIEGVKTVAGRNSLRLNTEWSLDEIYNHLDEVLQAYNSDRYQDNFDFIDNFEKLDPDSDLTDTLETKLKEIIKEGETQKLGLAHPYIPPWGKISKYKILQGRKFNREFVELITDEVFKFVNENKEHDEFEFDLSKIKIHPLNSSGDKLKSSFSKPLKDYLLAEVDHQNKKYILSDSAWFSVNDDYLQTIENKLSQVQDVTDSLNLIDMKDGEAEEDYNERTINQHSDWINLDGDLYYYDGPHEKVEVCDLLTPNQEFICVKKMNSSASLSHLFSQGSVSARLLSASSDYLKDINQKISNHGGNFCINRNSVGESMIVYALATEKENEIHKELFFFSKLNAVTHIELIESARMEAAFAKIEYK